MAALSSSPKNWGWGVTRRRCLNGSTIPAQAPIPDAKLAVRVYRIDLHIVASPVLCRGQPDGERLHGGFTVLESGLTRSLVANLLKRSSLVVREIRTLRTRLWTGLCETLMPDAMAPGAHQNDRSYVRELSTYFRFTTQNLSMVVLSPFS